jgi:hypothetical protein
MAEPAASGQKKRARKGVLWCSARIFRATLLIVLLVITGFLFYAERHGLPRFARDLVFAELGKRGWWVEASAVRWRWPNKITATDLRLRGTNDFTLHADFAEAGLSILDAQKTSLDKFTISNAMVRFSDRTGTPVALTNIFMVASIDWKAAVLRVTEANFALGLVHLQLRGQVTNYTALTKKKGAEPETSYDWAAATREWIDRVGLQGPAELSIDASGDFERQEIDGRMHFYSPAAKNEWGEFSKFDLRLDMAGGPEKLSLAAARFSAGTFVGQGLAITNVAATLRLDGSALAANSIKSRVQIQASSLEASNVFLKNARLNSDFTWDRRKKALENFRITARSASAKIRDFESAGIDASVESETLPFDTLSAGWKGKESFGDGISFQGRIERPSGRGLAFDRFELAGSSDRKNISITKLNATQGDSSMSASGSYSFETRRLQVKFASTLDPRQFDPFFTENGQLWLDQYTWDKPPQIELELRTTIPEPSATNKLEIVRESTWAAGNFAVGKAAFRQTPVLSAAGHFSYSNFVWSVPDLHAERPEGSLWVSTTKDQRDRRFHFEVISQMDLTLLRPFLPAGAGEAFDWVQFESPPKIRATLDGQWGRPEVFTMNGDVECANLLVNHVRLDKVTGSFEFTNLVLIARDAQIERGERRIRAPFCEVRFEEEIGRVEDGFSTFDPQLGVMMLGEKIASIIEPFHFEKPPTVRASGIFPISGRSHPNIHFLVDGTDFSWGKLRAEKVQGDVTWKDDTLSLSNIQARAYDDGLITGSANFDFSPPAGTDFHFDLAFSDADLGRMVRELTSVTNRLAGALSGHLAITSANTEDMAHWQGYGRASLRDGFLWEFPVFGLFSPILNAVAPGSGMDKAREATGQFVITNSVVGCDDCEIRASSLRLLYSGTVDFKEQVNLRVEAELFRDAWLIGRVLTLALSPIAKVFEYKVTGLLREPEMEPVYLPNFLMHTLHPFRSLKQILPEKPKEDR